MKLFNLSFKNVLENPKRSMTLGFFIFLVSLLMVLSNSFFATVKNNLENALIDSFTGHYMVRASEGELFRTDVRWWESSYVQADQAAQVKQIIEQKLGATEVTARVRHNAMFSVGVQKQPSMIIGLDSSAKTYTKSFELVEGRHLTPGNPDELLLSEFQAKKLEVKVGDIIGVESVTKDGDPIEREMKVVGIGNMNYISNFRFPVAFMDLKSAQALVGLTNGEVSDLTVYLDDKSQAESAAQSLQAEMTAAGMSGTGLTITPFGKLGGFLMSTVSLYMSMFNGFIGLLMVIVAILIVNLLFMIGLERRQEIGTLRAIGISRMQNILIFMTEIYIICYVAALAGIALGGIIVKILSNFGLKAAAPLDYLLGREFFIQFDWMQLGSVMGVVMTLVFIASFWPCYRIASLKPVDTLKEI
ncbi:ABC transporter permease [Brevibacillus dissolubilis]|uniref:ABC transporter permease n=1 Tax=Brevibacillus dissolubilis TaxID=1844116 RepID=UPI001116DD44|nr:FtsX-like permease family protein [Brevibacillus dissolubilis]